MLLEMSKHTTSCLARRNIHYNGQFADWPARLETAPGGGSLGSARPGRPEASGVIDKRQLMIYRPRPVATERARAWGRVSPAAGQAALVTTVGERRRKRAMSSPSELEIYISAEEAAKCWSIWPTSAPISRPPVGVLRAVAMASAIRLCERARK